MAFETQHPVFQALRERLLLGHWLPGTALKPSDIADELRVGISPVREALIRLTERDVVQNVDHKGFNARPIDPHQAILFCNMLSQMYVDSISDFTKAKLIDEVAASFCDEIKPIYACNEDPAKLFLKVGECYRRALLVKQHRHIADHVADVVYVYLSRAMGIRKYYSDLLVESQSISALMVEGQHKGAARAIQDFFRRRVTEVMRAQARLSRIPTTTNLARSHVDLSRSGGA
ncbi:GntR family transcriptional regulator [Bradyrhizobium sp. CNPSo 4010]|uniref:GntR family transcriptional regulator n=1 Tax=Bradyrhizobium agreste TaxID=2751811 RepID=A0ABS0PH03_9BRAD|nr:GntR family transcriptional regulator [Bradyrhizobium agreste]MBH5396459.1 GntR family transcriptional regulator [Bradyrhizobium agreste]